MIETPKLLNAIKDRVQIWQFYDIYSSAKEAKKAAARLFVKETGVSLKQTVEGSYIVLYWRPVRQND